jgi:protein O-mannosyl-transferase
MTDGHRIKRDVALVLAVVLTAYGNSLLNGFAYDDVGIIVRNPNVTGPGGFRDIWLAPYWPEHGRFAGLYRPLTIASFAVQWSIAGGGAWLFHLVNVALHATASLLVLFLLRATAWTGAALAGALIFALHPVHTEAVANVVGQAELMSAVAVLAACLVWVRRAWSPRARIFVVALFYAIGMLAKEHAVVLPGLLVLLDVALGRARDVRSYVRDASPVLAALVIVLGAFLWLRVAAIGSIMGENAGPALPYLRGDGRLLAALRAWPEYARLMFVPADLSADYSPAVILPPDGFNADVALGAVLLSLTLVAGATVFRQRALGLAAGWFLLAILPVSNLLFPIGVLIAERTLYLPSVAVAIGAAAVWLHLRERAPQRRVVLGVVGVVLLALFGYRTVTRNPAWADTAAHARTLYTEHPESYRAQWEAAEASLHQGDTLAAADHFRLAYRLWPHDPSFLLVYAAFLMSSGQAQPAIPMIERARASFPFSFKAEAMLGEAYAAAGRRDDALRSAVRLDSMGVPEAASAVRARLGTPPQTTGSP